MKKKYIVLASIVIVVLGLIIFGLYNNLEQQRQQSDPKTLTLSPNTIQIISIDNQRPLSIVCSSGEHSTNYGITYVLKDGTYYPISGWRVNGFVDFTQFSKITDDYNGASSLDISNFIDYPYQVNIVQFDIDGHPADVDRSSIYVNRKDVNGNRFSISLNGVSPSESHIVKATFRLEQSYIHINSNPVEVTYSMPKLC